MLVKLPHLTLLKDLKFLCAETYQRMVDRLTLALSENFATVVHTYNPLLWATERLGRAGTVGGGEGTLTADLRRNGFSLISACHGGGWTYKWKALCAQPPLTKLHVSIAVKTRATRGCLIDSLHPRG